MKCFKCQKEMVDKREMLGPLVIESFDFFYRCPIHINNGCGLKNKIINYYSFSEIQGAYWGDFNHTLSQNGGCILAEFKFLPIEEFSDYEMKRVFKKLQKLVNFK